MDNRIGVITNLKPEGDSLKEIADFGLKTCQLCCWNPELYTQARVDSVRTEAAETGINITSLWAGWPGPKVWDFVEGPSTLGIVPHTYRPERIDALKQGGEFAHKLGLPAIVTHLGFIPENATDPLFEEVVELVRDIALFLKERGL